ncbi:Uncharacterized protein HZ326_20864 [Fusarium oxysporum f. sp. albedinis]|nr:Uncharacterized protein HZ326_20864 [Fusarium oxysporum f. sp. albedinis]
MPHPGKFMCETPYTAPNDLVSFILSSYVLHSRVRTWSDTNDNPIPLTESGIALRPRKSDILRNYKCENPSPLVNSAGAAYFTLLPSPNQSPIFLLFYVNQQPALF